MRKLVLLIGLISLLVLAGCSQSGGGTPTPTQAVELPPATQQPQVLPTKDPAYPAPPTFVHSTPRSYPAPGGATATVAPFVVPTPGSDTAVVTGVLVNVEDGTPLEFASIYLGKKIYLTPAPGYTYGLQEASSPHSLTNPDGQFAIGDVPPGQYILMIFTPFGASVVMEPNTDRELDVTVTAGQLLDIGTMEAIMPELR